MSRIKLGIIGCGWVAPFHVHALKNLADRVEVVWTADPDLAKAEQIAATINPDHPVKSYTDHHTGLNEADAVSILVPHHLHHPITMDALAANCHVLLEKPFAISLAEADAMIETADASGRVLMIGYPHRYRKSNRFMKQIIDGGNYGRLFMIDAMMDEDQRQYMGGWLAKKETLGGGVFYSASPHMLDMMMFLAGEIKTISMVGTNGGLPMEGEDTALSVMKFKNGVVGATRHTWFSAQPGMWYTMDAYCAEATVSLTVKPIGDLATEGHRCPWETKIRVKGKENKVLLESDEGLDFTEEVRHFLDCIVDGTACVTDGRMARKMMAAVFNAYEKAEQEGGL